MNSLGYILLKSKSIASELYEMVASETPEIEKNELAEKFLIFHTVVNPTQTYIKEAK